MLPAFQHLQFVTLDIAEDDIDGKQVLQPHQGDEIVGRDAALLTVALRRESQLRTWLPADPAGDEPDAVGDTVQIRLRRPTSR